MSLTHEGVLLSELVGRCSGMAPAFFERVKMVTYTKESGQTRSFAYEWMNEVAAMQEDRRRHIALMVASLICKKEDTIGDSLDAASKAVAEDARRTAFEREKLNRILQIKANPRDWMSYYVLADWLFDNAPDQQTETEARQWQFRGQYVGEWLEWTNPRTKDLWDLIDNTELHYMNQMSSFRRNAEYAFCQKHGLTFIEGWPE